MDTCEGSQARHGPLAAFQTHMLVTVSYFLASAIIVIVAYFCLNRAWYIPHCCLCWPVGNITTGQVIWIYSVCGRCVVIRRQKIHLGIALAQPVKVSLNKLLFGRDQFKSFLARLPSDTACRKPPTVYLRNFFQPEL